MSRSKHTRPYRILAANRVRSPYESRGHGEKSSEYTVGRALKELGIAHCPNTRRAGGDTAATFPRLIVKRPRRGRFHPVTRAEVTEALRFFGETCVYGLRSISLVDGSRRSVDGAIRLGAYLAPGRILLFDQPPSPWQLAGRLPEAAIQKLRRAGAVVEAREGGLLTLVTWPGDTLRDFVLFDGLMHEIGHHIIQHSKGKRRARVLRTREHEELADRFAHQCRLRYAYRAFESG